jgi:hypothetical protein
VKGRVKGVGRLFVERVVVMKKRVSVTFIEELV